MQHTQKLNRFYLVLILTLISIIFRNRWTLTLSSIPMLAIAVDGVRLLVRYNSLLGSESSPLLLTIALVASSVIDYIVVAIIRKIFLFISRTLSLLRVISGIVFLSVIAVVLGRGLPVSTLPGHPSLMTSAVVDQSIIEFQYCNTSTVAFCLIPIALLIVVVLHKIIWPTLT